MRDCNEYKGYALQTTNNIKTTISNKNKQQKHNPQTIKHKQQPKYRAKNNKNH